MPTLRIRQAGPALAATMLALGAAGSATAATAPSARAQIIHVQAAHPQTACAHAVGPFKDSGTKVLQGNGSVFIPYGITVTGLAHQNYRAYTATDDAQIGATARDWCANTVRLQVAQDNLVGASGTTYSAAFMKAIKAEVHLAQSDGLVVVINAQTEDVGLERGPTSATAVFWKDLVGVYGQDPQVVFDLFNEPRVNTGSPAGTWHMWQQGGTYQGVTYLGEQTLLTDVRADGAPNLVWIEGPYTASNLDEVRHYPIRGGPLMYDIHHPAGAHNTTVWWADFGYLVKRGVAPVVVGEWTNYASATRSECWPDAPQAVPAFLTYLQNHGIGLTAWQLANGVLIESAALNDPTHIESNWSCTNGLDEGAGHQIMSWYERQNGG